MNDNFDPKAIDIAYPNLKNEAVLIQWLNPSGEWQDHGLCDFDKAGRLIGYGKIGQFYRALNPITREPFEIENPSTTDEWWGEVHDSNMTAVYADKKIAQMIAGPDRPIYRFTRHMDD